MVRRADERLDAIEAVYCARFAQFVRVAMAITGDRESALEAVQQAFADLIRARRSFRGDGPMDAWVWRAVVRSARRRAAEPKHAVLAIDEGAASNGDGGEEAVLRQAVVLLPERQRLAVFLRYFADLEYAQIAEVLGVTVGTVSASLHAAHRSLRRVLETKEVIR
jgi:RNA polymerase sigma-70 factor, ECF subfamily